jgi:ribulose-5-phosphate 4-epimerase/fuculose-1-phosphate aldolase
MQAHELKIDSMREKCTPEEWAARVDTAACYRLVDLYGMSDLTANHISTRVPGEEAFLINAYGLLYEEITASSLLKVDHEGKVLSSPDFGGLGYGVNRAGFVIHSAIHAARPEVACVIHTHSWASMAVSALKCGLQSGLCQTSMRFQDIRYHDFQGVVLNLDEQASLVADMGDSESLMLRNHGALVTGATVAEAFLRMHRLEKSCVAQLAAMACNSPLHEVPQEVLDATWLNYQPHVRRPMGRMEWPAMLRKLDRIDPSYRT